MADFLTGCANDATTALAAYHGPLLDGFDLADAQDFNDWLSSRRDELARRWRQLAQREAERCKSRGDARAALHWYARLVAQDPLQEVQYANAMRLSYLLGERARALAWYERLRLVLRDELGLEPLPETAALAEKVRSAEQLAPLAARSGAAAIDRFEAPFIGRAAELKSILGSQARVVFVSGEPGVGTTRLAQELIALTPRSAMIACKELSRGALLHAISEAIRLTLWTDAQRATLLAIAFAGTPTTGIFTGSPQNFYRSTDNGETLTGPLPMSPGYAVVDFAHANVGVALNANSAIRTADSGATWSAVNASGNGIDFIDSNTGIAVGAGGAILRSTDGGANWSAVTSPTTNTLERVHFAGAIGVAVGENGTIVRSADGGATWTVVASGTAENLLDVRLADANVAVAVGEGGVVLRSVNGGVSWSAVSIGSSFAVRSIDFGSSTTGVLAGELGLLMRTTDGGATWTGYVPERLTGIETVHMNGNNGVAVGSQTTGLIEWTADGGASWNRVAGVSTNGLKSIFMPTPTVAIAGGEDNLLRSTDGGQTWSTAATSPSGATFTGIAFVDSNVGVATGGHGGALIRTADGGLTWSVVSTGNTNTLRDVHFSGNTGIAVGFSGTIIRTTDGGQSWSAVPSGTRRRE